MPENNFKEELKKFLSGDAAIGLGVFSSRLDTFTRGLVNMVHPFSQVQDAATNLARSIGLGAQNIMRMSESIINQNRRMELSMKYNISTAEMLNLEAGIMSKLGRNMRIEQVGTGINNEDSTLANVAAASKVMSPEGLGDLIAGYDALGISMKNAAKATGKLFAEASSYGINFQKYASNFTSNLKMAQTYTFKNGVNGLKEMARKATEIRQDMSQVASFAEKVGTVTGAVETAAQLQVLGGSFAALSNPLAMLNESLTNMEGLQDRFNQMTMTAATYNQTTHQIEMDPWTRQQIKRAAQVMGVDAGKMIDQAYAQARRSEIERQTNGIGNLSTEFANLIKNAGEIDEYGRAGITNAEGKFLTVGDIAAMDPKQQKALQEELVAETRSEREDIKFIAEHVQSISQKVSGTRKQIENEAAFNNIREGVVNGLSTLDSVVNGLSKITGDVIAGAANIEHPWQNLSSVIETTLGGGLASTLKAFTAQTPSEMAKSFSEAVKAELGSFADTDLGKMATNTLETLANELGGFFQNATGILKDKAGVDMLVFTRSASKNSVGTAGSEPYTPDVNPSYSMSAKDVVMQAENFSLPAITAASTEGEDSITRLAREIGESIKSSYLELSANNDTMPKQEVYRGSLGTFNAQYSQQGNQETKEFSYNLNLTGTLNMNVVGDNGKIGEVDLMKMLKEMGFENELSKLIKESLSRMEASGQLNNQ